MGLEEFLFGAVASLLAGVVQQGTSIAGVGYLKQRKINSRIDSATAEAIEPLLPFLAAERISEDKQQRLIQTCVDELKPLTKTPEKLFQGSLDGQKIFDTLYADRDFPQVVIEDGVKDVYALLCPRVATLLCKIPAAVKDWENEAWSENFRRLDEVAEQLGQVFLSIDEINSAPQRQADDLLLRVRRSQSQKTRLSLNLTGLRADKPSEGNFDDFFVHPEIALTNESNEKQVVGVGNESFPQFAFHSPQSIIVAPAGAGKSTWTKWFEREGLTDCWSGIVIRQELRRLVGKELPSVQELIRGVLGKHFEEEATVEKISSWLKARQILFILDGFDEISPSTRESVFTWILDLRAASYDCPFVLTSRPLTTDHLKRFGEEWSRWAIEAFDEPRIRDYIQRWYKFTPLLEDGKREVDIDDLANNWLSDPTIEPLTGNPLLLSTLLMVHHLDGCLPSGRSQLYQRYVHGMLGLWDDRRDVESGVSLTALQKQQLLRSLALKMFFNEKDQIDEPDLVEWLTDYLQRVNLDITADAVLVMLRERTGLIIGPGVYSFAHKTLAEYLVAECIYQGDLRNEDGEKVDRLRLFEHRDDDLWNTVIFLWAGLAPVIDIESFIENCLNIGNEPLGFGLLYDQYERINPEVRKKLLLLSSNSDDWLGKCSGYYINSCPKLFIGEAWGLSTANIVLRNFSRTSVRVLYNNAINDGTISWSDLEAATGEFQYFVWILKGSCQDFESFKYCVNNIPSSGFRDDLLRGWICEKVYDAFFAAKLDFDQALDLLTDMPSNKVLVFMAYFIELSNYAKVDDFRVEIMAEFLSSLIVSDGVDASWLVYSVRWRFPMSVISDNHVNEDLFAAFLENFRSLTENGLIMKDTRDKVEEIVSDLTDRRSKLLAT
ncbi:MAG: NACHT domain-containing protein [bacterium]